MNPESRSGLTWRTVANLGAALLCVVAAAWVFLGGQRMMLISYVDLGFHELGHLLLAWAPGLVPALAGSVTQVVVPLALALYFALRRESHGTALMLAWAATSAANVSVYVADGPNQALSLLGNGRHDWAWVFGQIGRMEWAAPVASGVRWFAIALAVIGFIVAIVPVLTPGARARSEARRRAAAEVQAAAARARAPRREPRNTPIRKLPEPRREAGPPPAPAGRF